MFRYRLFKDKDIKLSFNAFNDSTCLMSSRTINDIYNCIYEGDFDLAYIKQVFDKSEIVQVTQDCYVEYITVHQMGLPGLKEVYVIVCEKYPES